jgi:hypothetical protein
LITNQYSFAYVARALTGFFISGNSATPGYILIIFIDKGEE